MSEIVVPTPAVPAAAPEGLRARLRGIVRSPRMSASLIAGLIIIGAVLLLSLIGSWLIDPPNAIVGAVRPAQRPSAEYLLGTDSQGRDVSTILIIGTPLPLRIGLIAGIVGVIIGVILGLISGYFGV